MLGFSQMLSGVSYILITFFTFVLRCNIFEISSDFSALDTVHKWLWKNRFQYGLAKLTNQQLLPVGLIFGMYKRKLFIAYVSNPEGGEEGRGRGRGSGGSVHLVLWNKPKWLDLNEFDKNGCKKESQTNTRIEKSSFEKISFVQSQDPWIGGRLSIVKRQVVKSAKKSQLDVVDFIIAQSKQRDNRLKVRGCVVLIHGPRGSGKSCIGKVLAVKLKATFCPFFNPTQAGDWFDSIYAISKPTDKNPLVVMIEEVDTLIKTIVDGNVVNNNKEMKVLCSNKASWNNWFDTLPEHYPNVYIVMTMNSSIDEINEIDSSMIRDGRVDAHISFGYQDGSSHDKDEEKENHMVITQERLDSERIELI